MTNAEAARFNKIHIRKVYACLAVTCHLHFWQNDRDFLRATVVTRGWNSEIRTGIFSKSVTLWTALQVPLWSKPHLVFRHKVYEIATQRSARYTHGRDCGAASKSARFNCTNWTHFRLTSRFRGNSCIVMLWVACELLQFAAIQQAGMVRAFCRSHAYTFNEQYKMATALTP